MGGPEDTIGPMGFPDDGGLSCVRYYLAHRGDALEHRVEDLLRTNGRLVGRLVCQCGAENQWGVWPHRLWACASCACNGSSLPIYIGAPPRPEGPDTLRPVTPSCGHMDGGRVVVGIGYQGQVPPLDRTVEVERAQEVLVGCECVWCGQFWVAWELHLDCPPEIRGDEPWLQRIQGYGF